MLSEPPPHSTSHPAIQSTLPIADYRSSSLVHALSSLSNEIPTEVAYTFLRDGEDDEQNLTFRELELRAKAVGAQLQRLAHVGERAALVFDSGLEYIVALAGCLYAGIVAVPVYPPDPMRIRRTGARLRAILQDSQSEIVLTGSDEFRRYGSFLSQLGSRTVVTDEIPAENAVDWEAPDIGPQTLAILQYTSGSTGNPRGVMLTHTNLMFNFEHILKFDEPDAVAVSWLPMYHDMGLIGLVLQVFQSGRRTVLMSPLSFVKRPFRWLRAISKYRAYATSGPSFAYDLCVQKISDEELAELDLSCWTLACNGAEPVRPDTLRRFTERFASVGFRPEAFYPCFGLAEATLIVSGGDKRQLPVVREFDPERLSRNVVSPALLGKGREVVGCGRSVDGQEIAIVDPQKMVRCNENEVGEIWVRGPGVAQGYWSNAEATEKTFQAYLADTGEGPFLRTGDLGFLCEGELFVNGRIKDMIVIRGRNHYPHDVERTVEGSHPALRRDNSSAFAIEVNGEEQLAVLCGIARARKTDFAQVLSAIRSALLYEHEVAPYAIVLVRGSEIPRTSSGKLQRHACKELYLSNQFPIIAQWRAGTEVSEVPSTDCETYPVAHTNGRSEPRAQVVRKVSSILRELKNGSIPASIDERSRLFADLSIESIDLVMLNELIERHYQRPFPFTDFMAELGRKDQRDVSLGQFAEFILLNLENHSEAVPAKQIDGLN